MASHVGRHRQPRSNRSALKVAAAPLVLVAPFAVTGFVGASPAAADDLAKLRACESGGNYRAVNPSGKYRGAYQFDFATWRSVGGTGDPRAASPAEQDKRARILYNQRGNSPWPQCGKGLNLNHGGASQDNGRASASPASRSTARKPVRKATVAKVVKKDAPAKVRSSARVATREVYTVQPGDTLSSIARRHKIDGGYKALFQANRSVVENPNLIYVGEKLRLPK